MNIREIGEALRDGFKIKDAYGDLYHMGENGEILDERGNNSAFVCLRRKYEFKKVSDMDKFSEVDCEIVHDGVLDDREKEYLRNLVNPFRERNPLIQKKTWSDIYELPEFESDSMYKRMRPGRYYTLEELGL